VFAFHADDSAGIIPSFIKAILLLVVPVEETTLDVINVALLKLGNINTNQIVVKIIFFI
jgi:hypothetical protein